jgi:hypothetical protein
MTIIKKKGQEEPIVDKDRTFFCSELVAKAYKVCGVMQPTDEACSNFLPIDFTTESKRLKLVAGAKLSNEMQISIP